MLSSDYSPIPGCIILVLSLFPLFFPFFLNLTHHPVVKIDLSILSFLLFFTGISALFYGRSIFLPIKFSWLLLLLFIPAPMFVLNCIIEFFRHGSAAVVDLFFQLLGIDYIRNSLTFHLPNISIFIAKECSGIRSSTALLITTLLAGQLFLKTAPGKTILLFFVPPLTILKNGIRITTLTILADKVDTAWLTHSKLHHNGGIVFFAIILLFLFGIIKLLQKAETNILINKNIKQSNI